MTRTLLQLNYQLKNYDKAIRVGNRAIKGGFATDDNKRLIAQAYYLKGDYKSAQKAEDAIIDAQVALRPAAEGRGAEARAQCLHQDRGCRLHAEGDGAAGQLLPQA